MIQMHEPGLEFWYKQFINSLSVNFLWEELVCILLHKCKNKSVPR